MTYHGMYILSQDDSQVELDPLSATSARVSTESQGVQNMVMERSNLLPSAISWGSRRVSFPNTLPPLSQTGEIATVDYNLHNLRKKRLEEYKQAVYICPSAKPSLQAPDEQLCPLMHKVKNFLAGEGQVMLILGDSGAGKSTFNRHLEYELWQDYKPGNRIPLFVSLPTLDRPEKELIAEQLIAHSFSETQIRHLEQNRQFILICDGYDESKLTSNLNTTNSLCRSGQRDAKLLITCRTQYLGPDYRDQFVPMVEGMYHRAANNLFQEAVIAPFSKDQIEDYLDRYIPLEPRVWTKKDYMDKLTTIPNLMDLVKNPFLLTLALEALPRVIQGTSDLSRIRITRVQLYDIFVEHWLGVNKRRLQSQKLSTDDQKAFNELKDDGFERNGIEFQQGLAAAIFQEQDGRPVVDYSHRRDKNSWKVAYFGPEADISLLRAASLLSRTGNQHRFVHRSVLEYFFSRTICGPTSNNNEFAPHCYLDTTPPMDDHPLSRRKFIAEPSIVQFLAERVQLDPDFKQQLLTIVEQSKNNRQATQAAVNAITILVKAGEGFNGSDLRGIQIPGADLSGGQFDSAHFQGADLTGVNLSRSWIRQADFCASQMEGVQFEDLPYLEETEWVESCALSPDGESLAAGLNNGDINIYNTATWTRVCKVRGHSNGVTSLAYSPDGRQILSGGKDRNVRLWGSGAVRYTPEALPSPLVTVLFSPTANQFALAGNDPYPRLCDSETGTVRYLLQGHVGAVTDLSYSPDGRRIASCGFDGTIRLFDTQTGLARTVFKSQLGSIHSIAYSPDGRYIASGYRMGKLQLWETTTGKEGPAWKGHTFDISCTRFSPNGQLVASSSVDGTVKLWDAHTRSLISVFVGHHGRVTSLMFTTDGSQLVSSSRDKTVRLWEVNTAGSGFSLHGPFDPVSGVAYSPSGLSLFFCRHDWAVQKHNAVSGELEQVFSDGNLQPSCIKHSTKGPQIATAGFEGDVRIWNAVSGNAELVLEGHQGKVNTLAFSPCGQWIATGSIDRTVGLWDLCSGELVRLFRGHRDLVTSLVFSPTGLQILSGSRDGTFRFWDVVTGSHGAALDRSWAGPVMAVDFSPNGLQVATCQLSQVRLLDAHSFRVQHIFPHTDPVNHVAYSPCGQWVVTCCDRSAWLWSATGHNELQTWKYVTTIKDFFGHINSVAWRPYSLEFATGCDDGTVRVWKVLENSIGMLVQMIWSLGPAVLASTEASIASAIGLSTANRALLMQRGAIFRPQPSNRK